MLYSEGCTGDPETGQKPVNSVWKFSLLMAEDFCMTNDDHRWLAARSVPVARREDGTVSGVQVVDSDRDAAGPEELEARRGEQGVSSEHGWRCCDRRRTLSPSDRGFLETSRRELKRNDSISLR